MIRLLRHLRPYKKTIFLAALLTLFQLGGELMLPTLMTLIINQGVAKGNPSVVWKYGSVMLGIALLSVFVAIAIRRLINKISVSYAYDVRNLIFSKSSSLSAEQFNSIGNASMQSRSTHDVNWMTEMINWIFRIVTLPLLFVGGIVFALSVSPQLSAISLIALPCIILILILIGRFVRPLMKVAHLHQDKSLLIMRERMTGLRVIRAFGKEQYEDERFEKQVKIMSKNFIRNNSMRGSLSPLLTFINSGTIILLLWFGSRFVSDSQGLLTTGDVMAVIQYVNMIIGAIAGLSFIIILMPMLSTSAKRLNEVFDMAGENLEGRKNPQKLEQIELQNMTFTFSKDAATPVLDNITMTLEKGKTTAILGGTGSGKSTLAKLLLKFHIPTEGSAKFDGIDLNELSAQYLRDSLAYVSQIPVIFRGTIRSNILLGNFDATEEQILTAVEVAQLGDFVRSHPEGLDYPIAEGGKNLSGGQKQRLSIARALVRDCNILIFDDSFSALDYATDLKLRTALEKHFAHKTKIIITQRVATALNSDRIYVLEKGTITASGTHDELLSISDTYSQLARLQMNIGGEDEKK